MTLTVVVLNMRIPNIYTSSPLHANSEIQLDDNAAHHLAKVLRKRSGFKLQLFNGDGFFYPAELTEVSKKTVQAQTGDAIQGNSESSLQTHIGQVMSRGDRMDYMVQKATELGVNEITPLFSERCEVRLDDDRQAKRHAHWQQVAISAAEQSGRARIPVIHAPSTLEDWIAGKADDGLALVLHHRDTQSLSSLQTPQRVNLLIGPEGGLSPEEIAAAQAQKFIACTLGPRVFRSETAPVAALSVLQWLWGDF